MLRRWQDLLSDSNIPGIRIVEAEREADLIGETMTRVCDAVMPRSRPVPRRAA
jgi:hypothetical protein